MMKPCHRIWSWRRRVRIDSSASRGGRSMTPGVGRVHAKRERGQTVGDQVDPQQLQRQQRGLRAEERRDGDDQHLGHVARQQEQDDLAQVVEDGAAFSDGFDDGREVVVGEHHVGGLARDVGAHEPHRHADVGALEGRCVVDAVAGHRDDLAVALERVDDAQLVLGVHARVDADVLDLSGELVVGHLLELDAGHDAVAVQDADLLGDGAGGERVVAGDHRDV